MPNHLRFEKIFILPIQDKKFRKQKQEAFIEASRVIKVKPWLIGGNIEYEYENNEDNLLGAFAKTLNA